MLQPFGQKSGHVADNWALYEAMLVELARVTTDRAWAALLTADKRPLLRVRVWILHAFSFTALGAVPHARLAPAPRHHGPTSIATSHLTLCRSTWAAPTRTCSCCTRRDAARNIFRGCLILAMDAAFQRFFRDSAICAE